MTEQTLILDRYKPLAQAGAGGFGTVQVAWDVRIQRKVAIKCIPLSEADVRRASLPGADAVKPAAPVSGPARPARPVASAPAPARSHAINPDDVPPWEDLPAECEFAGGELVGGELADGAAGDGAADEPENAPGSLADALTGSDARPSSPSASISLTQADAPLVHTLARIPGLDEARTAAMLSDPNIVTVYDFEIQDSTAYLIMEYVEGLTLTELLRDHDDAVTLDVVAAVFDGVSHALEVAHAAQVLHLDIKPDNILINAAGQVKVTDFGLATLADASGFGQAGGGTIGYMPLEQMRQQDLDVRCDEWALASVTYEMLAGENPFLANDLFAAQEAIEDGELVLPSLCWDDLDGRADDVIFDALDPDREHRYATVADFADDLAPLLGDVAEGRRALAAIVCGPDEEEVDEDPAEPAIPLRERITPGMVRVASHAFGCAGSALVAFVSLANIPETTGFENPLFWGLLALIALAGALRPHLGALLAFIALSVMVIVQGIPAAGCLLLAASGVWWWFVGRGGAAGEWGTGDAPANAALALPLAAAFGLGPLGPLVAGFCLRPLAAMATACFQAFVALVLASFTTGSLLGWDVLVNWYFTGSTTLGMMPVDRMVLLLGDPQTWIIAASWVLAAGGVAVLRLRPTRLFAALGVAVGAALLLVGLAVAAAVDVPAGASAGLLALSATDLAAVIVPTALLLFASYLLPDPEYVDD